MKSQTKSAKLSKINTNSNLFLFLKALILSLIVTFISIIIFALIIKFANLNDSVIAPVNLVIKGLSILLGTIVYTKNREGGLKKGLIFSASYITIAYVIFSALSGSFNVNIGLLLDYVFGLVVGSVVGIIRVNKKVKA